MLAVPGRGRHSADMRLSPAARQSALLIALMAGGGLALQAVQSARNNGHPGALAVIWSMSGYFTVATNGLVLAVMGAAGLRGRLAAGWAGAVTLSILMVATVYHTLLARLWAPQGLGWWADLLLHTGVPAAMAVWWWACCRRGRGAGLLLLWLGWPALWGALALIRGAVTGFWPYPFMDGAHLAPLAMAANLALVMLGFVALGGLMQVVSRR